MFAMDKACFLLEPHTERSLAWARLRANYESGALADYPNMQALYEGTLAATRLHRLSCYGVCLCAHVRK